jgi:hypothetical protein
MPQLTKPQIVEGKRAEEARKGLPSEHDDNKTHYRQWKDESQEAQERAITWWTMYDILFLFFTPLSEISAGG